MINSGDEAELKVEIPSENGEDPPPLTLEQDRQLYDELLRAEFCGPRYDVFAQDVWTYGIHTLTAWMRTGAIAQHCYRYNVVFDASEAELSILARTSEVREALAVDSITAAAPASSSARCAAASGTRTRVPACSPSSWADASWPSETSSRPGPGRGAGK